MSLIDSIIGAESGGDPNARNSKSSASGLGQFLDSTWLDTIKATRPDIAQGKSDAELLALKTDPQMARDMTAAYAAQNGGILSRAGYEASPGNIYLAHFAGPQGATKVLQADPNTPVSDILGASAVKANPFMRNMTAGDLQAWAARKMGGEAPMQPAPQTAPVVPVSPPNAPLQLAPAAPVFPQAAPQQAQQGAPMPPPLEVPPISPMDIHYAQRRPVNLANLRAALARAPIFAKG